MIKKTILSIILSLALCSCGIKGDLSLPDEEGVYIPPQDNK